MGDKSLIHYSQGNNMKSTLIVLLILLLSICLPLQAAQRAGYVNSIGMEFVDIPPGCFMMGRDVGEQGYPGETPLHRVCITQPFQLGRTEVTQAQWEAVMGSNPSFHIGPQYPVERVDWDDVHRFIHHLNQQEGGARYRLPTEAEWEYAVRAGTTTAYYFGDDPGLLPQHAWYRDSPTTGRRNSRPVAQLLPNSRGLYDMYGNVFEWVQDWYDPDYYRNSPMRDPQGPLSGDGRVVRGGGWLEAPSLLRSAVRQATNARATRKVLGFRVLRQP
jgi:formylglycine-generating enzyme required for sulfatase activity